MADENSTMHVTLHLDDVRAIRYALHIGLESFSEVERITDLYEMLKHHGGGVPEGFMPTHPTGSSDTIGIFTHALRAIEDY